MSRPLHAFRGCGLAIAVASAVAGCAQGPRRSAANDDAWHPVVGAVIGGAAGALPKTGAVRIRVARLAAVEAVVAAIDRKDLR